LHCIKIGNIIRVSKGRLNTLTADSTGQVIGCIGSDNIIELFHFLSEDQVKNKKLKRIDKLKRKAIGYVMNNLLLI
jgi:U3 small nucleolar RNA-associated protein 12